MDIKKDIFEAITSIKENGTYQVTMLISISDNPVGLGKNVVSSGVQIWQAAGSKLPPFQEIIMKGNTN